MLKQLRNEWRELLEDDLKERGGDTGMLASHWSMYFAQAQEELVQSILDDLETLTTDFAVRLDSKVTDHILGCIKAKYLKEESHVTHKAD
jgi:hypothetical protein